MKPVSTDLPSSRAATRLADVHHRIVSCERCPRLRAYCRRVAREKTRAHRGETYWARPVPGFGDPDARLLIVGLAPAAHGANRTGRAFTGDGPGGASDFLMAALHRAGFASLPFSRAADDGLALTDAYITMAVRCAPPQNRPAPEEIARCLDHLGAEVERLPRVRVIVALGRIAFDACLRLLARRGLARRPRPQFAHGAVARIGSSVLVGCYHPSRQNTNTGRLTAEMIDGVFRQARALVEA
ncbi:MAG TPA: uracil-DNA glycosylase [Vicinamibacterales bacterium]|nr:uracil-DNA glycosylase [Vicinamibacterales bacterium]